MVVRTYFDKNDTRKSCPVDVIQATQCKMLCSSTSISSYLLEVICLYYLCQINKCTQSSNAMQWILNLAHSANKWSCLEFIYQSILHGIGEFFFPFFL